MQRFVLVLLLLCMSLALTPPMANVTQPAAAHPVAAPSEQRQGGVLQRVRDRGRLICGIHGELPGFSYIDSRGIYSGFDVDFCRVVATAIFGDPSRIEFRTFSTEDRFTAIQEGSIDVLFRNTTWTASRDATEGLDFGPTVFYDGQSFMLRRSLDITQFDGLGGHTVCVQRATTSEANLLDYIRVANISIEPRIFDSTDAAYQAYDNNECDAITSDRSQLVAKRSQLRVPSDHIILEGAISREPLGPVVIEDDSTWRDVVSWAIFATIYAEEQGVNQSNVESLATTENPNIRRLLGYEGTIGTDFGLPNDFALQIIRQVGNYEDIYNRNLGPATPFNLERGPNKAWNNGVGGVLAAPPFR